MTANQVGGGGGDNGSAKDHVRAMMGSQLRATLSDGRVVVGRVQCMDRLTNFILAEAVETAAASQASGATGGSVRAEAMGDSQMVQRHLGLVMIPGKHLVRVERMPVL